MGKPELRFPEFTEEWEEVILNDVMKRVSKPVDVEKETLYRQIGIRSHGKGLFYKENVTGKELGNKRVFWIEPDCLVLNIVFAWERAVARTTKDEVGMIASHRFPMYKTADDRLDLDYAVQYLTTKRGSNILILASPGGAGRNKTLGQEAFLKSRMLLPNIAEQKRIVELLKAVNDVIAVEQKQVSLWEEKKKCAMQKIFSQEIRFKADDGSDVAPAVSWMRCCMAMNKHFAEGGSFDDSDKGTSVFSGKLGTKQDRENFLTGIMKSSVEDEITKTLKSVADGFDPNIDSGSWIQPDHVLNINLDRAMMQSQQYDLDIKNGNAFKKLISDKLKEMGFEVNKVGKRKSADGVSFWFDLSSGNDSQSNSGGGGNRKA